MDWSHWIMAISLVILAMWLAWFILSVESRSQRIERSIGKRGLDADGIEDSIAEIIRTEYGFGGTADEGRSTAAAHNIVNFLRISAVANGEKCTLNPDKRLPAE